SWPVRSRPTATSTRKRRPSRKRPQARRGGADMHKHPFDAVPRLARLALLLLLAAVLGACGRSVTSTPGDAPNLEKWVAEVKNRPAPPLDPLPVMQQFETFEYAAQALRDPFSNAF